MKTMTIKDIAALLQKRIDVKIETFITYQQKIRAIHDEIENIEKDMLPIIEELEPVESLIYAQNPKLQDIFESLKRVHGKESNGIDRTAH